MSSAGTTYARDDDPELVRASLPVIIKTMEQIHESLPKHQGLATALTRTVTSFGAGFVVEDADRAEARDMEASRELRARARRLFLRARGYGLDALDLAIPGLKAALTDERDPKPAQALLARAKKEDVPALYWTGAAWGSAIAAAKNDLALVGQLPRVEALMRRALELDEAWDEGSIHEFFVIFDGGVNSAAGGAARAKQHLERALALSKNKKLSPLVSYSETVCVDSQDKKEFTRLLEQVLAFDVDSDLDHRLVNILAQRRARWLLGRTADLFAD